MYYSNYVSFYNRVLFVVRRMLIVIYNLLNGNIISANMNGILDISFSLPFPDTIFTLILTVSIFFIPLNTLDLNYAKAFQTHALNSKFYDYLFRLTNKLINILPSLRTLFKFVTIISPTISFFTEK